CLSSPSLKPTRASPVDVKKIDELRDRGTNRQSSKRCGQARGGSPRPQSTSAVRVAAWGAAPPQARAPRTRNHPTTTDPLQATRPERGEGTPSRQDPDESAELTDPAAGLLPTSSRQRFWSRTSSASRNASPMKLKATTVRTIAIPAG